MRETRCAAGKNSAKCGAGASDVRISCMRTSPAANRDGHYKTNLSPYPLDLISNARSIRYDVPANEANFECAHATVASHYDTFKVFHINQTTL